VDGPAMIILNLLGAVMVIVGILVVLQMTKDK
jgi:hypothetical protein